MSGKSAASRTTADAYGDVVVLLIGMRVNHFWAVHQWLPVMLAMLRMLAELKKDPGRGLLSRVLLTASPRTYYVVQYWESAEKLYAYASAPDAFHHAVWARLNRMERDGKVRGHVGIWHETYVVPEGRYEAIYGDMPAVRARGGARSGAVGGAGAVREGPAGLARPGVVGTGSGAERAAALRPALFPGLCPCSGSSAYVSRCGARPPTGGPRRR